jgi:hypothetical protein
MRSAFDSLPSFREALSECHCKTCHTCYDVIWSFNKMKKGIIIFIEILRDNFAHVRLCSVAQGHKVIEGVKFLPIQF